jgi:type VI secretion system protein ImpC
MSESIQKVLARRRAPRVKITYDVETGGAAEKKELPFIVGILGDLSGDTPSIEPSALKERKMVEIDSETFDSVVASFNAGITFSYKLPEDEPTVDAKKSVLGFSKLEQFTPLAIVERFKPLTDIYEKRADLRDIQARIESDDDVEHLINAAMADSPEGDVLRKNFLAAYDVTAPNSWGDADLAEIAATNTPESYRQSSDKQKMHANRAFGRFTQLILASYDASTTEVSVVKKIDTLVANLDANLSHILNQVLHNENFQRLEASWRGLFHLVSRAETGTSLKLRVLNLTRKELKDDLFKAVEFDQSHLFKLIYEAEYGTYGGAPYSLLVGDYNFGRDPESISLLEKLSQVAASAHAPFLAAASPDMFGLKSFDKLAKPRDLAKIFESVELNEWRGFRDQEDSRYVSLTLPRILLRLPYGEKRLAADGLRFEEQVVLPVLRDGETLPAVISYDDYEEVSGNVDAERCLWGNPAYFLAERITHAFSLYGWTAAIRGVEGGGLLEGLPSLTFKTADGDIDMQCPTEVAITDRREKELNDLGFITACHCKGTNRAAFFGGQTTNKPKKYLSDSANSNAQLSSMLPYMLAASRFAHYLKVIMRDKVGRFMTRGNVEAYLNQWIAQYILLDDEAPQEVKASFPLREARINVTSIPGKPGAYNATLFLKPHFQLEELTTSIRLVAELPA